MTEPINYQLGLAALDEKLATFGDPESRLTLSVDTFRKLGRPGWIDVRVSKEVLP